MKVLKKQICEYQSKKYSNTNVNKNIILYPKCQAPYP